MEYDSDFSPLNLKDCGIRGRQKGADRRVRTEFGGKITVEQKAKLESIEEHTAIGMENKVGKGDDNKKHLLHPFPILATNLGLAIRYDVGKIGRDIGNSIRNFMAADSRSWSSDQAKFVRIRVNIPLDKPLRRCGVVASPEGEKFQVYFRYERLPVFLLSIWSNGA
ncbi:hypothetical protein SO802_015191 [Lithocarpus litseifolius]|uniref:Uncharacterized protein n=1 Tax=Lithocarpus litseifolius TaxID=425828 RepID=A0AAW2CT03_9ROSI